MTTLSLWRDVLRIRESGPLKGPTHANHGLMAQVQWLFESPASLSKLAPKGQRSEWWHLVYSGRERGGRKFGLTRHGWCLFFWVRGGALPNKSLFGGAPLLGWRPRESKWHQPLMFFSCLCFCWGGLCQDKVTVAHKNENSCQSMVIHK